MEPALLGRLALLEFLVGDDDPILLEVGLFGLIEVVGGDLREDGILQREE